jgi:predicted ATP-grasp superfamily ATP-dependent carboligase
MKSVRAAWDKRETYRIAAELGIPVPRCWFPSSMEDLSGIDLSSPVVVKPAIKEHFFYATGAKAWRADDATQLREAYQRACAVVESSEIIIQELVPGGGARQLSYCALFKDGRTIARMTAVRLRQHPSDFGRASTFVRTESLDELEGPSTRFLRAIEYYGLVELEYKRDPRDDVPKLLDVNARTWGYHSLGVAAGVDFPYLLFRDQLSLPVDAAPARDGVSWIRAATDLPNATRDMWRRDLRVADYLRTLRGIDTEAVFSRSDPWPGIAEIGLLPYLAVRRGL